MKKFTQPQRLPPDVKSLTQLIKRVNYAANLYHNCLDGNYLPLSPLQYGWMIGDSNSLVPILYEGSSLTPKIENRATAGFTTTQPTDPESVEADHNDNIEQSDDSCDTSDSSDYFTSDCESTNE